MKPFNPDIPELIPGPCPTCGATTEAEAESVCTPKFDITGEGDCEGMIGGEQPDGMIRIISPDWLAELDRHLDAENQEEMER